MFVRRFLLLAAACAAMPCHADLMLGNFRPDVNSPQALYGFRDGAMGDALPLRVLGGPATHLQEPIQGFYEAREEEVFVADFRGEAIRVFRAGANGDAAPLRELSGSLGQVRSVSVDYDHDTLVAVVSNCCVETWPRLASGNATRLTLLSAYTGTPNVTQVNNPGSAHLNPALDEIIVSDYDPAPPYAPKILFFNRTDTGNVAPKRVLKGTNTRMESSPRMAVDRAAGRLYVVASTVSGVDSQNRILVFSTGDGGNVAPLRAIEGPNTQLNLTNNAYISGIGVDAENQRLLVAINPSNSAASGTLLTFDLAAGGNAAPLAVIGGVGTGIVAAGTPLWLPERIFRGRFDAP